MKSEWRKVKLGDLVEIHDSRRVPLSKMQRSHRQGPYRYYGAQGVIDYIDQYLFDGRYMLVAEDGENLRSRKQPVAQIVDGQFWVNNHAHILSEQQERSDLSFLNAAINQANISGHISGAAQPKLTQESLRRIEIPCPGYETQRRIGSFVNAFALLIEVNERRIAMLEDLVRSLYREWFVHFRFPGHADAKFGDDGLPEGWERVPLDHVAEFDRSSVSPCRYPDEMFQHYSIPAFDSGQLSNVEVGASIKSNKFSLDGPRVLLSKLNPRIKRIWVVSPSNEFRAIASSEFMPFKATRVSLGWLWALFDSQAFQSSVIGAASGTSTSHQRLQPGDLLRKPVVAAVEEIQSRFDGLVTPVLKRSSSLRAENAALRRSANLILPRLVTGQLDISDIDLGVLTPEALPT